MLKKLRIKQFAIIDDIELEFFSGMTVLTGETGAGKSIIIDAISLLLGERADKTMIRNTADQALVEGVFYVKHPMLKQLLSYENIDYDEDITIERTISKDNQNVIKINNQRVTLKFISQISEYIADIHSQFDTSDLIHPEHYIKLIDDFRKDKVKEYIEHYQLKLKAYLKAYDDYFDLKNKKNDHLKQMDLYQFQLKELNGLNLEEEELESLQEKVSLLSNVDKINYNLAESYAIISEQGLLENLYQVKKDLEGIASTSKEFSELSQRINDIYYELEDINNIIEDKQDQLDYDPNELEMLNERINDLEKVQKKYQKDILELINYREELKQIIDSVEHFDDLIIEKEKYLENCFNELVNEARQLSSLRQTIAKSITKEIIKTLQELEIKHADFKIDFDDINIDNKFDRQLFRQNGIDQVDFLISTNKGEPLKPLSKTASGGEMSRVMLTFKTIFAQSQKIPTIIFDEIDTGISGYIAKKIGRKIAEVASFAQVISITHIPQVVAEGVHHISIRKDIINDKTKISVKYLSYDERVEEIAQMMSAESITESARDMAKQLLIRN
jgi:DNA repair protein RecN (Recombination protein N)